MPYVSQHARDDGPEAFVFPARKAVLATVSRRRENRWLDAKFSGTTEHGDALADF